MSEKEYVEITDCDVVHETPMAVLIDTGAEDKVWVPKSLIGDIEQLEEDGVLIVPEWFALDKGLI